MYVKVSKILLSVFVIITLMGFPRAEDVAQPGSHLS